MTSLATVDEALRRTGLTALDRASLLVARKRVFEDLRGKGTSATEPSSSASQLPEGPKGEE